MNMDSLVSKVTQLRHELHAHPELSLQEKWTKAHLMQFVKENTSLEVADRGHWFYAVYTCTLPADQAKPPILIRADFDAVAIMEECELPYASQFPGVAHKCGHDGHASILAGLTIAVEQTGADRDIYFVFQHAEEIGAGGEECAKLIREKGIAAAFAFHNMSGFPKDCIIVRDDVIHCASKGLTIRFQGKTSHASEPEEGINPAFAIARLTLFLEEILTKNAYRGMVLGTVVDVQVGSKNFGISAGAGEISLTLRGLYEEEMLDLEQKLRKRAEELACQEGMSVSYAVEDPFPVTVNDRDCNAVIRRAAANLGLQQVELPEAIRASEDFGYYQKKCPGAIFFIGNGETYQPYHTTMYDFNDAIIKTALLMEMEIIKNCP